MPSLDRVTPVLLTLDEAPNIGRSLERLGWADRVVVVDSGSEDGTREIARGFANTALLERPFDTHARQWSFALEQVDTQWALTLDADYLVPKALVREIAAIPDDSARDGFRARFRYVVLGVALDRSLYPPRQILVRAGRARFRQDGHTQRVEVEGRTGRLETPVLHDDRKPTGRWLRDQAAYARREAEKLTATPWSNLDLPDRLRRTRVLGPPAVFLYCLLGKGLVLEGWAGWFYTMERTVAEAILSMALLRRDAGR